MVSLDPSKLRQAKLSPSHRSKTGFNYIGSKIMKRIILFVSVVAALFATSMVFVWHGSETAPLPTALVSPRAAPPPEPRIQWNAELDITLAPTQSTTRDVTFTSSHSLSNARVYVPPSLQSFLTVSPSSFASVPAGVAQPLHLTFNIPAGANLETILERLKIEVGQDHKLERGLKVVLNIWQQYTNMDLGYQLLVPPTLSLSFIESTQVLELADSPADAEFAGFWVQTYDNPTGLTVQEWWSQSPYHSSDEIQKNIVVSGQPALQVSLNVGFKETHIIVASDMKIYELVRIGLDDTTFNKLWGKFIIL
jgi:hypothetical protein